MKKLFPLIQENLNKGMVFCIFVYWVFCFVLFPFLVPIIAYGAWENLTLLTWVEFFYYVINGLVLIGMLKQYLGDAFLNVQIDPKGVLNTVLSACMLMIIWLVISAFISKGIFGDALMIVDVFPISEMGIGTSPGLFVTTKPLLGTLCMVCMVPFTVTGLFYTTAFGQVCTRHPWLGYLVLAAVLVIPVLFELFWRGGADYLWFAYLLRLPIHWFACWTYQKTDTVWAPIFSLALFNLVTSVANIPLL